MTQRGRRTGFALVSVLWAMVGAGLLAVTATLAARDASYSARNRIAAERALWIAHDCGERAHAAIDELLRDAHQGDEGTIWPMLGSQLLDVPLTHAEGCDMTLEAAGTRLDINSASDLELLALFRAMGRPDAEALADALLDWRDMDNVPRPSGAEASWYASAQKPLPRNGNLADVRELKLVRGFSDLAFDSLLGTEPAPLALNSAPLAVLASVPGFGPEVLQRVAQRRADGRPILDVLTLVAGLSEQATRDLLAQYPEIMRRTTVDPVAWTVTARGHAGLPAVHSVVELRLGRAGRRAVILRRRTW